MLDHELTVAASSAIAVDAALIPTGAIEQVSSSFWLDFRKTKAIGDNITHGTVARGGGYDNALLFDGWAPGGAPVVRATLFAPATGIGLEMSTDQASVQVYSGNGASLHRLSGQWGMHVVCVVCVCVCGRVYVYAVCYVGSVGREPPSVSIPPHAGLSGTIPRKKAQGSGTYPHWGACTLEAQGYIGAVNQPSFPSAVLRAGDVYRQATAYRVFVR